MRTPRPKQLTKRQTMTAAGIDAEHYARAQAYFAKYDLSLDWYYPRTVRAGFAIIGYRKHTLAERTCFMGILNVDIEAACDQPQTTRKRWEAKAQADGAIL